MTTATLGMRYVSAENAQSVFGFNQGQLQETVAGEFRFDEDARYTLHTLLGTGSEFNGGWNNTGLGSANGQYAVYWKQLYFSAEPIRGFEFQYGGLGIEQGVTSDTIGYSEDGYITGQRLAIHRPKKLFLDTIAVTYGYLGDFDNPGLNQRFHRLKEVNFRQYLVSKHFGSRTEASLNFTNRAGSRTVYESVKIKTAELHVIDAVRLEFYQRFNDHARPGLHLGAEKALSRHLRVEGGYVSVDRYYGDFNSDSFLHGNRFYGSARFPITPALSLFAFGNHGIDNNYGLPSLTQIHFGISYDVVKAFDRNARL